MKTVLAMIFFALSVLLNGCETSIQHGDARVTRLGRGLGRIAGYDLILPPVPLTRAGTTKFRVVALPTAHYSYQMEITGGSAFKNQQRVWQTRDPLTRIAIQFAAPDGSVLLQTDRRRGLDVARAGSRAFTVDDLRPADAESKFSLDSNSRLSKATDYEVSITVIQPAQASNEVVRINGFGPEPGTL